MESISLCFVRSFPCEVISVQIAANFPLPLAVTVMLLHRVQRILGSASFLGPCSLTVRVDDRFAHVRLEQGQMISTLARGTGIARETPWNTRKRGIIVCPNYTRRSTSHRLAKCDSMRLPRCRDVAFEVPGDGTNVREDKERERERERTMNPRTRNKYTWFVHVGDQFVRALTRSDVIAA